MKNFFSDWVSAWNEMLPPLKRWSLEQFPLKNDADEVCDWLCAFIKQTHKNNRGEYTPKKPIPALRCKIRMKKEKLAAFNLFADACFESFQNVCENQPNLLQTRMVLKQKNSTWNALLRIMNVNYGRVGLCAQMCPPSYWTMSYSAMGKNLLTWRRGALVPQALTVTLWGGYCDYMYAEHGSKYHSGGFKLLHLGNKIVHQFENPEASRCDHVRILDLYFAKL